MRNSYNLIGLGFIAAIFVFSSCSRQTTSISQMNKLSNAQALENQKAPVQKTESLVMTNINPAQTVIPETPEALTLTNDNVPTIGHIKKLNRTSMASVFSKKAGKEILKQANVIRNLGASSSISSYSKTNHTEGWLGFAIACLIVAVILFALGFGALGSVFWVIGSVILVVAIIFFVLWLLAMAVS